MTKLVSVVLDIPTPALDAPYTYVSQPLESSESTCTPKQCGLFDAHDSYVPFNPSAPDPSRKEARAPDKTHPASSQTEASDTSRTADAQTPVSDRPCTDASPSLPLEVGCAVVVPLGGRKAVGFVVALEPYDETLLPAGLEPRKLKPIEQVVSRPFFNEDAAACAFWLSERYIAPLSSCVRLFVPPGATPRIVRTAARTWQVEHPVTKEADDRWVVPGTAFHSFVPRKNAVKQLAVLEALREGELRLSELTREFGAVGPALEALQKKNALRIEHRRRFRGGAAGEGEPGENSRNGAQSVWRLSPRHTLNKEQQQALDTILQACAKADGTAVLLDGVTGSGKTEVYLRALEQVLEEGRTGIVLVPEISLTPQTVARFRGRFGNRVAVMHSRMSAGERFDQWDFIRSGKARVVVGARSALFTPMEHVGLIVLDEEHESSYKQDQAPRYHARDVALWMARRSGAVVVLGSATPSIETLYACETDPRFRHACLHERANGKPLPPVRVFDMAQEFTAGSRSMFAHGLAQALVAELHAGHKAVLLLNQRGFAKFVLCRECGFVPECPSCSTSLTFHERGNALICHHCGYRVPMPPVCPVCKSPYLKKFGAGTQRVEDELRLLLDGAPQLAELPHPVPVIRMDADTTSGKGAHRELLERFAAQDAAVLLGTQMIAKGLDFDEVTLVGVIDADTMLKLPDYRSSERTFDLIEQVAGRAGRSNLEGRVFVQTYSPQASAIQAAAHYDRASFLHNELPKRRLLGYPPFVRLANILVWGKSPALVERTAQELHAALNDHLEEQLKDGWTLMPALPCLLAKLRSTYRWHVVVKCPRHADLSAALLPYFGRRTPTEGVNVAVDIDPDGLL